MHVKILHGETKHQYLLAERTYGKPFAQKVYLIYYSMNINCELAIWYVQ